MKKLFLLLALLLWSVPALAQNPTCPTRPPGDNTNACASTAFVQAATGGSITLPDGKFFIGSAANVATAQSLSQDCTSTRTGVLTCLRTNNVLFGTLATLTPGTGVATALAINVGSAGAFVTFNGAGGTPSSITLTNGTGLPIAGITGLGTGVATGLATAVSTAGGFPIIIAKGTLALATGAISSATCTSAQTASATGTATTDVIDIGFNGDPTAVTGYVPLTAGMLTIIPYPTANTVNVKVCNNTSGSITPGAITLNWKVVR